MALRYRSLDTGGEWVDHDPKSDADTLRTSMESVLLSDRLVVLAGLGSSLCVEASAGASPPTMSDLWEKVKQADKGGLDAAVERVGSVERPQDIEVLLSRCQAYLVLNDDSDLMQFVRNAEQTIADACNFISSIDQVPTHATFLRKLARRPATADRFRLFTTNYDLAFEFAASAAGLISIDGFSQTSPRLFDVAEFERDVVRRRTADGSDVEFVPGVHYLHKLHGSIDWERRTDGTVRSGRLAAAAQDASSPSESSPPCIVFPRDNKFQLSYEPPFFDLLANFQSVLREDNVGLIVTGFGFADLHIVRPILTALRSNTSLAALFIDPRLEDSAPDEFLPVLRLLESRDPRITLVASKFETAVDCMPNLHPETHLEAHAKRVGQAGIQ